MKKAVLALFSSVPFASVLFAGTAIAAQPADVTVPIRQFIDGFNTGDTHSAFAAYEDGDITIVDEFPPHRWTGPHAAKEWADDYQKHAAATGVTEGLVKYSAPTRTEIEDDLAYVIIPTVYLYKQNGQPFAEEGQATFVLHAEQSGWKIRSWTWSGVKPHPAK
jgi:hypothetical protein